MPGPSECQAMSQRMKPPVMNPSTPPAPPGPRLQRWAVRLCLLVAGIGSVATSQPRSPEVTSEYRGPSLSLTTAEPKTTQALVVRVSSEKHESERVDVELTAQVTARWRPTDPTQSARPWLRANLSMRQPFTGGEEPVVLGEPGQPVELLARAIAIDECKVGQSCQWSATLELELQQNAAEGSVDVDWNVVARAQAVGTSEVPAGLTVQLVGP